MFILFAGQDFYASGGWGDYRGAFDTKEEAVRGGLAILGMRTGEYLTLIEWWHVADTSARIIVAGSKYQATNGPDIPDHLVVTKGAP